MLPSKPILSLTVTANGAVTKHRAVGFDGAQASVLGQKVLGVPQYDADDGDDFACDVEGALVIEVAEPIAVGAEICVNASGKAVNPVGSEFVFGDALSTASADGELIKFLKRQEK